MILDRPRCSWRECWSVVIWAEALGWNLPQRHREISFERFALLHVRSVARDSLGSLPRAYARGYKPSAPSGSFVSDAHGMACSHKQAVPYGPILQMKMLKLS